MSVLLDTNSAKKCEVYVVLTQIVDIVWYELCKIVYYYEW